MAARGSCPGLLAARAAVAGRLLAVVLLAPLSLVAQEGPRLRGVVVDVETGVPVGGAEVLVQSTPFRVTTGADGSFQVALPDGREYTLVVLASGFRPVERNVDAASVAGDPLRITMERLLFEVPGLTVTASRRAARPGAAPISVAVIGADELERRNVTSLKEALPFAQGVTFNAGHMDIRGSSGIARGVGSRVLMLLDGHRVLGGVGSDIDFGVLPLLDIERIEIVKGPHSTLWGTNAMGGVVNVITRAPPGGQRTVVRGYYGVFDTPGELDFSEERLNMDGIELQHSRRIGGNDLTLSVAREGSDGFRQNGAMGRWRLRFKTVFGPESATPWEVFASWKRQEAEEFFTWLSADRRLEVDPAALGDYKRDADLVVGLTAIPLLTSRLKLQIRPQLQHVRSQNYFHDNADFHRSTRYGTDAQLSVFSGGRHALTVGGDGAYTTVASNFLSPTPAVTDLALFAQDEIELSDRMRASVGVRLDSHRTSFVEDDLTLSPKIGLVYQPGERVSLRTSFSRGYRAPSVSEQFTSTTVFGFRVIPNLEIRGESAWAGEVGATASPHDRIWLDAGLFWSEYAGLIEVGAAPNQYFTFQFQNVSEARVRGIDTGVRVGLVPSKLNLHANYMYVDSKDQQTGRHLAYRSRHNLTTTLSGWSDVIAVDVRHRSRPDQVLVYPLDERGAITLLDLRMAVTIMDMDVHAKIANLLQTEYVDVQERNPGATRSVRFTVTSRF